MAEVAQLATSKRNKQTTQNKNPMSQVQVSMDYVIDGAGTRVFKIKQ
jgi:hypothetical protein